MFDVDPNNHTLRENRKGLERAFKTQVKVKGLAFVPQDRRSGFDNQATDFTSVGPTKTAAASCISSIWEQIKSSGPRTVSTLRVSTPSNPVLRTRLCSTSADRPTKTSEASQPGTAAPRRESFRNMGTGANFPTTSDATSREANSLFAMKLAVYL